MQNSTLDYSSYPANQKAVWLVANHFADLTGVAQKDKQRYWKVRSFRAGLIAKASETKTFITQGDIAEYMKISDPKAIPVKLTSKASKKPAKKEVATKLPQIQSLEERVNNIEDTNKEIVNLLTKLLNK